jgi:ribonucleoside-diphosphate reductase alpha chain
MYLYAWEQGLKTTYYLRSRPATRIRQATVSGETAFTPASASGASQPQGASSADTPEICEACQ